MQPNDAAIFLADCLHYCIDHFIPQRKINMFSSSHPWLNDRCRNAVERKNKAYGHSDFGMLAKECSQILLEEYHRHRSHQHEAQIIEKRQQKMVETE